MISTGQASTSGTTALLAGSATKYAVIFSTFCNTASSTETITIHTVVSGDTADDTNVIVSDYSLPGGDTLFLPYEKILLDPGDSIVLVASLNAAITYMFSYTSI